MCGLLDVAGSGLVQGGRVFLWRLVQGSHHLVPLWSGCGLSTNVVCVPWWWVVEGPIARHQ